DLCRGWRARGRAPAGPIPDRILEEGDPMAPDNEMQPMEEVAAKVRVRLHVEKFDMTDEAPRRTEYLIVDDEGRVERPEEE
ncbi:hypothetical protein, partial [Nocardioides sp.]|uniref:hypothetical protein n=1 Tax=Nocardioides sp. TaxID=35761 RepID=UPI0027349BAE